MLFPQDCPAWIERLFSDIEEKVDSLLTSSKTSDDSMRAAGAYSLWKKIKEEVDLERQKQELQIRQRNERLNARNAN